jgi:hypothetical protein
VLIGRQSQALRAPATQQGGDDIDRYAYGEGPLIAAAALAETALAAAVVVELAVATAALVAAIGAAAAVAAAAAESVLDFLVSEPTGTRPHMAHLTGDSKHLRHNAHKGWAVRSILFLIRTDVAVMRAASRQLASLRRRFHFTEHITVLIDLVTSVARCITIQHILHAAGALHCLGKGSVGFEEAGCHQPLVARVTDLTQLLVHRKQAGHTQFKGTRVGGGHHTNRWAQRTATAV